MSDGGPHTPTTEPGHLFCYEALPTTSHIRLVRLLANFEGQDDEIRLALRTVDITNKPKFSALSYTWGNPCTVYRISDVLPVSSGQERNIRIICNGSDLYVTQNLYAFLKQWRSILRVLLHGQGAALESGADLEMKDRIPACDFSGELWIDAVCINQTDLLERSQQVAMMSSIYETSLAVWIWLGPEDWLLMRGFRFCERLSAIPQEDGRRLRHLPLKDERWLALLGAPEDDDFRAIYALFHRAWFQRAWIIQELVFSGEVWVMCGPLLSTFGVFRHAASFLISTGLGNRLADYVQQRSLHEYDRARLNSAKPIGSQIDLVRSSPCLISTKDPAAETSPGHTVVVMRGLIGIHDGNEAKGDFLNLLGQCRQLDAHGLKRQDLCISRHLQSRLC